MRRTTSSLEFPDGGVSFDVEAPQPLDQGGSIGGQPLDPRCGAVEVAPRAVDVAGTDWLAARFVGSMLSPRGGVQRSNPVELSGDHPGTAPFLRACGLCNRRLGPGRDAFMYRYFLSFHLRTESFRPAFSFALSFLDQRLFFFLGFTVTSSYSHFTPSCSRPLSKKLP